MSLILVCIPFLTLRKVHSFSETDKLNYSGIEDDGLFLFSVSMRRITKFIDNMFHFTCFNVEDPHDPSVGLINGQLSIPGNLLRREVFDPVVNEVRHLSSLHSFLHGITHLVRSYNSSRNKLPEWIK